MSEKHKIELNCRRCGKPYVLYLTDFELKNNRYSHHCSRSCANAREHSDETKKKISESLKNNPKVYNRNKKICVVCGNEFFSAPSQRNVCCSKECVEYRRKNLKQFLSQESINKLSKAGRHSAEKQANERRSKNETYFCELCESVFSNVLHNEIYFNGWDADVIMPDIKIAVLWNGPWHYKKLKQSQSLKQIQTRDEKKIQAIKECRYIPYIIKDTGKYNKSFVQSQFQRFIEFINELKNNNRNLV